MALQQTQKKDLRHSLYPGISTRIVAPFLLAILTVAAIGIFIITRLVAGSFQERFTNQLIDSANVTADGIVDIERKQLATLRLMVFTEGIPQAIIARRVQDLDTWLRPIAANAKVEQVIIFDSDGQGIWGLQKGVNSTSQYAASVPPYLGNWGSVQKIITGQKDSLGDKFIDVIGQPPNTVLYTTAPVLDENGKVVGGISIGLSLSEMVKEISKQSLSAVSFFADDGTAIASTLNLSLNTLSLSKPLLDQITSDIDHNSPIQGFSVSENPYQMVYARFKVRGQGIGFIGVALPSNFIVEKSGTSRDAFGLLFSLLFIVIGVLGLLTARTITRPVSQLLATTRAIRSGDLSKRVQLNLPDELGELSISFDIMTDALVKRNAEINQLYLDQIRQTAQRDAILESISDAVIVQDTAGKPLLHNASADQLMRTVSNNSQAQAIFLDIYSHPNQFIHPKTVSLIDRFFSVLSTTVCTTDGDVIGYVLVFRDISVLIETEKLKDELILQLSHELRTPLTAVRGYVDLAKLYTLQGLDSRQSGAFLENATISLDTLERLVSHVIDVSEVVSDHFSLEYEHIDLIPLVYQLVSQWMPLCQERNLVLSTVVEREQIWIDADARRLQQVLDHLLRNAYSYTLPDGSILVKVQQTADKTLIIVQDTGVGIAEDEIDKVFERMYRGRSAEAGPTDSRGLGLGLYLAKRIVDLHNGQIHLASEVGQGTTVTVILPVPNEDSERRVNE